jgi:hypothetical protein
MADRAGVLYKFIEILRLAHVCAVYQSNDYHVASIGDAKKILSELRRRPAGIPRASSSAIR